jgi:acetyl-CoA carboxylase biotin carboxylase subunit
VQVFGDGDGQCDPSGRTRLFAAAPPPEGVGRGQFAGAERGAAHANRRDLRQRDAPSWAIRGAGTVEFLYEDGKFYFIEMNTRLQVEHPVTEAITGIDLVNEQMRVAAGAGLSVTQDDIPSWPRHRVPDQCGDPETFVPLARHVTHYHPRRAWRAGRFGVYQGYKIPPYYDSLIGKLIVHGRTRVECMMRLRRALDEFVVDGISTTIPLFRELLANPDIANGDYDIHWLEKFLAAKAGK